MTPEKNLLFAKIVTGAHPKPVTAVSNRDHVMKHIAESMNEVKVIMERMPSRLKNIGFARNKEFGELASIITGRLTRTEASTMQKVEGAATVVRAVDNSKKYLLQTKTQEIMNQERAVNSRPKTASIIENLSIDSNNKFLFKGNFNLPLYSQYPYQPPLKVLYSNAAQMKIGLRKGVNMNLNPRQGRKK